MMELHIDLTVRVRSTLQAQLTDPIPLRKGVKQGCLLAPFLFNFYINDIVQALDPNDSAPPSLKGRKITVLLYADDMVILSLTRIGLRNMLSRLATYCNEEHLVINYNKTKIISFGNHRSKPRWFINSNEIEQCSSFKYLGIIFQSSLSWQAHLNANILQARRSMGSIINFFYANGGQLVAPALKVFQGKIPLQEYTTPLQCGDLSLASKGLG